MVTGHYGHLGNHAVKPVETDIRKDLEPAQIQLHLTGASSAIALASIEDNVMWPTVPVRSNGITGLWKANLLFSGTLLGALLIQDMKRKGLFRNVCIVL